MMTQRNVELPVSPRTASNANGKENAGPADALTDAYLSQLLSYSLDTFNKEPQALRNQQEHLRVEITNTAVLHYQGFINAASSFSDISHHVEQVQQQLQSLVADMKQLNSQCSTFASQAASIQEKRKQIRSLLGQHSTVLELLEVPQLIDTCVRNGNYDEALDLMAFMNKVTFVHSEVPVVKNLLSEVKACSHLLLEQLLARLSSNVMLPESLRSISYIRRLGAFSELELRQRFLQCRESWLNSVIDGLNDSNPADFIRQLTDVYRLHIFDIVMQYRAIFSEIDSSGKAADAGADAATAAPAVTAGSTAGQAQGSSAGRMLYAWAQNRVQVYVDTVEKHFPRIQDGNSLAAVIEACMYCGKSLSRVGLDFRGLLLPVFSSTVLRVFELGTSKAILMFATTLENHKWAHMPLAQRRPPPADQDSSSEDLSAAYCLLEHPPLAVFANAMISALNSVRSVALLRVSGSAAELMQGAVRHACGMLVHHGSVRKFMPAEVPVHAHACKAICDVVCPLLSSMFRQVFSPAAAQPDFHDSVLVLQSIIQEAKSLAHAPSLGAPARATSLASATPAARAADAAPARAKSSAAASAASPRLYDKPERPQAAPSRTASTAAPSVAASPPVPSARLPPAAAAPAPPASTAPAAVGSVAGASQRVAPPPAPSAKAPEARTDAAPPKSPAAPAKDGFSGFGNSDDEDDDDEPDGW